MEFTITRVESKGVCSLCNEQPIAGVLILPHEGQDNTIYGCANCIGEKVKQLL